MHMAVLINTLGFVDLVFCSILFVFATYFSILSIIVNLAHKTMTGNEGTNNLLPMSKRRIVLLTETDMKAG